VSGSGCVSIVVVGGPAKGVGKTALICGVIVAMPEREWTAIKITSHTYGRAPITEEVAHDVATDTGRYLQAGAKRALLVEAGEGADLALMLRQTVEKSGNLIVESNRIVQSLTPDLCLGVLGASAVPEKPSFAAFLATVHGLVARTGMDWPAQYKRSGFSLFAMDDFGSVSPKFAEWMRDRLSPRAR
jgi:hypothetical protein